MKQEYTAQFLFKQEIPYATIPKEYLKDNRISLKAKGLLTIIYTLPSEWNYNMKGLQKISNLTEKNLRTTLNELIEIGYIMRDKTKDKKGRFKYIYMVNLVPMIWDGMNLISNPPTQKRQVEKGKMAEL